MKIDPETEISKIIDESENSAQKVKKSRAGKGKTMYYIHRQLCLYIFRDMVGKFLPRCRK